MDDLYGPLVLLLDALKKTEKYMSIRYDYIEEILPKDIFFITTQELADRYPDNLYGPLVLLLDAEGNGPLHTVQIVVEAGLRRYKERRGNPEKIQLLM